MGDWLNANAAAIQALAIAATVLLTVVLAAIIWRYVRLTRKLVSARTGEAAARGGELRTQLELISNFLRGLRSPDDPGLAQAMLGYSHDLWDMSGSRVRALAAEISTDAGHQAAVLEEHVTWLINLVRDIRSRAGAYDWSVFPKREYEARVRSALDALQRLLTQVGSREKELPDSDSGSVLRRHNR